MLADANSNSAGKQIADEMGDASIQYGLIHNMASENGDIQIMESRIGFANSNVVYGVKDGARLQA